MNNVIQRDNSTPATIEQVLIGGDLSPLTPPQRLKYYQMVCDSLGLNPLTKPFEYLSLNNKLVLYATRTATEQLRKINGVSITGIDKTTVGDIYVVTASACDKSGRSDASTGAVSVSGLRGDALANAIMKAETKAKRRVTLSLCGLGMLDESEIETVPNAQPTVVNIETGELALPSGGAVELKSADTLPEPPARKSATKKMIQCPDCGEHAVIKSKKEFGGGFSCWKKEGGCGHKFQEDDARIAAAQRDDSVVEQDNILPPIESYEGEWSL